ncbi:MAG: SDR family oxidoreductase [Silvibacterium sp.]|nr:SDR family oxidoreductase [Silvibacterium sp.]
MSGRLLVTGAAGHLGRRVIEHLIERKAGPIIATTRDTSKIADLATRGVEVRMADFDKPETLVTAFAGADRMLMISTDAISAPGRRLAQHKTAVAAAERAGVKHIVYTSFPAPRPNSDSVIEDDHFWTEQAIAASSLSWTFMRHGLYTDGLARFLQRALQTGTWATATQNRPRHYVTRDDCARADAAALASGDTSKRIYEITGPAAPTPAEVAAIVSDVIGRQVAHVNVPADVLRSGMEGAGLPPTVVGAMIGFDIATALGFHAIVTPAVEELTGRAPASVRDFVTANKAAFGAA